MYLHAGPAAAQLICGMHTPLQGGTARGTGTGVLELEGWCLKGIRSCDQAVGGCVCSCAGPM